MSVIKNNLRLRECIGITQDNDGHLEFFKANTRETLVLKMRDPNIIKIIQSFNGKNSIESIAEKHNVDVNQLFNLAILLKNEFIFIDQDVKYPHDIIDNIRLINTLEDYFHSTSDVIKAINRLKNSCVMIIGAGAVGSYIAIYLAKLGIGTMIVVDNDQVELSNLHRQYFFEKDIGCKKTEALKKEVHSIDPDILYHGINSYLTKDFFINNKLPINPDLIINCADEPSVDETSRIVAKYSMDNKIPHIIGGGYNLHLTLIGQTIIPFETACFECFNLALNKINIEDHKNVRILERENRKLGSFSPLSGIASSLAALDAFKVLVGKYDLLQQTNKRIEFNTQDFTFYEVPITRDSNCSWCKKNDKFN